LLLQLFGHFGKADFALMKLQTRGVGVLVPNKDQQCRQQACPHLTLGSESVFAGQDIQPQDALPLFLTPDEFVWIHMKNNGVSKKPLKTNESLQSRIDQDLNNIRDKPKLVKSFFHANSVVYAKD
jgi:hypothetical protein